MKHYYQHIQGWFEQTAVYKMAVEKYNNAKFVEIGCHKGRGTSYMGVEIINSGKFISLDCINTNNDPDFSANIEPVSKVIGNVFNMKSVEGSKLYVDNSLDAIILDASYLYDDISVDLNVWWPKLKIGGMLIGDDNGDVLYPGYVRGVNQYFGCSQLPDTRYYPNWYIIKK